MEGIALPAGHQQAVDLLEKLLGEAKAGRVPGIAVVLPRNGQCEVLVTGSASAADLYLGGGLLQQRVLSVVVPVDGRPTSLLRVGG